MLPDERVVLYRKCTETLLNTWHKWKFRQDAEHLKGRVERRNRQRIEAIAHWMHRRGGDVRRGQRAIAPYEELRAFLVQHIEATERWHQPDADAIDLAEEFLEFVKKRAGLLIEVCDGQYSFVHLTFQEYLTATHILTTELARRGSGNLEEHQGRDRPCPRWREVIRLLIADLKSTESQEALIDELMGAAPKGGQTPLTMLLAGLLLDGIEPAEARQEKIVGQLLWRQRPPAAPEELRPALAMLRAWLARSPACEQIFAGVLRTVAEANGAPNQDLALALLVAALEIQSAEAAEFMTRVGEGRSREAQFFRRFVGAGPGEADSSRLEDDLDMLWAFEDRTPFCAYFGIRQSICLSRPDRRHRTRLPNVRRRGDSSNRCSRYASGPGVDLTYT